VDTVHECDRRTDRQTDRITITNTVQRRASHGNNYECTMEWDPEGVCTTVIRADLVCHTIATHNID